MKNFKYLVWAGTAVLVALVIFLLTMINHIANTATNTNTISFSGEGKVFAVPDIAAISFSILTEATTSKAAQNSNSTKSKQIVDFLKSQNIEDKDIKTTGYNIYPQYSYPLPTGRQVDPVPLKAESVSYPDYYPGSPKITGYQVNQSFEVKVRDLEKISTILDGLVSAGANQVNNLGFKVDNEEELKEQARELAIKDAKEKAKTLKKQLGISLGKIIGYNEGGYYPVYFKAESVNYGVGGVSDEGPSVPAGENEIVVNVTITYQVK